MNRFWNSYLLSLSPEQRNRAYYEAFRFGNTGEAADRLAELVLDGTKTATSDLLWSRQATGRSLWKVGDEHIVLDGKGSPVCVIRTTDLRILPFKQVDEGFARDYGEGDRTLEWWRRNIWRHYEEECRSLSRTPSEDMPLICERFEVVYPRRTRGSQTPGP